MPSSSSTPRFSTILVARTSGERPTDLEVQLRQHCQKIRVVSNLSSAHVIFPQEQGLALRVYYPDMQQRWEHLNGPPFPTVIPTSTTVRANADIAGLEDIDGIRGFCHSFRWSFVIFVVPDTSRVLDDSRSMVQQTMRLVDAPLESNPQQRQQQPMRILLVHDTSQVIQGIVELANGIAPQRCALRRSFCTRVQQANFCDVDVDMGAAATAAIDKGPTSTTTQRDAALAIHVRQVVIDWANRHGLPRGEAELLMNALHNLSNLAGAAKAPHRPLDSIPVEDRTKQELLRFFSGSDDDDDEENVESVHFQPDESIPKAEQVSQEFILPMNSTFMEPSAQTLFPVGYTLIPEKYDEFEFQQGTIMSPVFLDPPVQQQQYHQQVVQQIHPMHQPLPKYQVAPSVGYHHPSSHYAATYQHPMHAIPSFQQGSLAMTSDPSRRAYPSVPMTPCYVVNQHRVPQFQHGVPPSSYFGTPEYPSQGLMAAQQQQGMMSSARMASVGYSTTPWQQGPPSTARVRYRATPTQHGMLPSTPRMTGAGYQTRPQHGLLPSAEQMVSTGFQPTRQPHPSIHPRASTFSHTHASLDEPRL